MKPPCAAALALMTALATSQAAYAARTVDVSARRVEFRRHDSETGDLTMHMLARSAVMSEETAGLSHVRLIRYEDGRPSVVARSERGEYRIGRDAILSGGVGVEWTVGVGFRSEDLLWSQSDETMSTDSPVGGYLRSPGDASSLELDFAGLGLRVDGDTRSAEIPGHFSMTGRMGEAPFAASADGGVAFRRVPMEGNSESLLILLRGPVIMSSRGAEVTSDRAEMRFLPRRDGALAPGGAQISGAVRAVIPAGDDALLPGTLLPSLPRGMGRVELRAELIEITAAGAVVLYGTMEEPARVIFDRGELRGTRIELSPGGARTDGGAPSEFDL